MFRLETRFRFSFKLLRVSNGNHDPESLSPLSRRRARHRDGKDCRRHSPMAAGALRGPVAPAGLQGGSRPARPDACGGERTRHSHVDHRHCERRRLHRAGLGLRHRLGARGRARRGVGIARASRRRAADRGSGEAGRPPSHRGAPARPFVHARNGQEAKRQAAPHRRNRLCRRQEVHGARDRERIARARRRCRFPRDGPDGNLHLRPRHRCRLGRVGFRLRRCRVAVTACRTADTGT